MSTKYPAWILVATWLIFLLCVAFFPSLALFISGSVPFAHLVFAPLGSTRVSTTVFALTFGWLLLLRMFPALIDQTARSIARMVGMMIGLAWIGYVGLWLTLYALDGL